jgi:hypothetical protein
MADQDQKQQSQSDPVARTEAGDQNEYGTSQVDASYGSAEQEIKDRNAQTTSIHKDQYPQIQENPFVGGTEARGEAGDAGTSEKSV